MARKKNTKKVVWKEKVFNKTERKRPVGVVAIAVLVFLIGLFVAYDFFIFVRALFNGFPAATGGLFVALFFVVAVICFFSVYGLFKLRNWGKILTVVLSAAFIIYSGFNLSTGRDVTFVEDVIIILVFLVIGLYLLFSKKVKESFK